MDEGNDNEINPVPRLQGLLIEPSGGGHVGFFAGNVNN